MKRRAFLSLAGAAGIAPALPTIAASAPVTAGYNRYMYGLAVFHARTRATISAADLMARLKINAVQAEAMMGEMQGKGVIAPMVNAANSAARALDPHVGDASNRLKSALRKTADWLEDDACPADAVLSEDNTEPSEEDQEINNGQV